MNRDQTRSKLQIGSLCALLALAILFAALTGISRQTKGISYEEGFLKLEQQEGKDIYSGKMKGEIVTAVCYEENGTDIVEFTVGSRYHFEGRVEHPEGTITTEFGNEIPRVRVVRNGALLFSGGYDKERRMFFTDDGEWEPMISVKAGYSSNPWYNYEFTAGNIFYFASDPAQAARGSWGFYAVMVFISLLFALEIAFPETIFYLEHFLSVRDPEPSDFFWAMHNISCVALPLIVLVGYIFGVRMIV